MDFSATVKTARTLESLDEFEAAEAVWEKAAAWNPDYLFQVQACHIIVEAKQMTKELPQKRTTRCIAMIAGGKNIYMEERK